MLTIPLSVTQNFLKPSVIDRVFTDCIPAIPNLPIIDIGAGSGNITSWLEKHTKNQILAYELDQNLAFELRSKFGHTNRVSILPKNFLTSDALTEPYAVVANIPFMNTTAIIKQLTTEPNFREGYLVMQKEAAERFGGYQVGAPSTLQSILLELDFTCEILHKFLKSDFQPTPQVTCVLFHMKRKLPVLDFNRRIAFEDFVAYLFNKSVPIIRKSPTVGRYLARRIDLGRTALLQNPPSALSLDDYLYLFTLCDAYILDGVAGSMERIEEEGSSVQKIYRTRESDNWNR